MAHDSDAGTYPFSCRECGAEIVVDGETRDELLEYCCVLCGAEISTDAFERRDENQSR